VKNKIIPFFCLLGLCLGFAGCSEEIPAQTEYPSESVFVENTSQPTQESISPVSPSIPVTPDPEPNDDELVKIADYIPTIYVELKYAAEDNFTGQVIYDFNEASLRYGTVRKLAEAQAELLELGYSLKIWDAYRPVSAQFKLWEVCPDPAYVANPNTGYSGHSKGNTIDVTLVKADGTEIEMPSGFDDFSALADRDYSDASDAAAENARLLEDTMSAHGFKGYWSEWWHFTDSQDYPVV